ncbi:MAG: metallophosphoesterase [Polyangiaceae bacterium]
MPGAVVPLAAALAVGSAVASHARRARRAGVSVTFHRVPWDIERRVRVAHLTDVHVGPTTPQRDLLRVAEIVRDLGCDVVAMTGDYVNTSLVFRRRVTDFVSALPKPCVATLGNHDHWASAEGVTAALTAGGATVLRNEAITVRGAGFSLAIVGVDDGRTGNADVARAYTGVSDREAALVLTHFPSTTESIAAMGARLVLAGHTHAGQVSAPFVSRVARLAGLPYLRGFHRVGATDMYVSAGIGHSLTGLRSARTAPEIAVFELDPDARARTSERFAEPWDPKRSRGARGDRFSGARTGSASTSASFGRRSG